MTLDLLFNGANIFVLPFWVLMVLLPNWEVTRRIMASPLPFMALAGLYLYLFISAFDASSAADFASLQLADVARLFSNQQVAAAGWVHYLVMDLFVGRWIYQEGQRTGVWTLHSLVLCLFAGPLGLLSHLLTSTIVDRFWLNRTPSEASETST
ncbi:MAG: ABA4-like family protein [Cyanobacteria bacterium]|nr:ABA4-like family protein [Cyanobacteriota bacterium]MDW8201180.1 ABA4-like family protein [Cyanobacteriota bacterium SKYGB_h_bin112]